ncbi:MAG: malto-oligosyltrehalose synthase [Pirellulales bacterium]|nr:malto-oligosyltrehalose synthase [Pirellulales bacterium]
MRGALKKKLHKAKSVPSLMTIVRECFARRRIPAATYRLQFHRDFTFRDATAVVPYLEKLGISDCYASPIYQSRSGSPHGYDVCDHGRLNPDLGTEEDFQRFIQTLTERGMGLILDVVPNHMGVGDEANAWWMDVLENGASSVYAPCFDIDWEPANPALHQKVLLPVLGDQFGKVLEAGQIRLVYENGAFHFTYFEMKLPIAPRTYIPILEDQLSRLVETLGETQEDVQELRSILTSLSHLPLQTEVSAEKIEERNREKEVIKRRLTALCERSAAVRKTLDATVGRYNGTRGDPRSFDLLEALLDQQAYRPAFWRVATEEINYRRFFDVNELAAICTENPVVFQETHQLVLKILAEGKAGGLRIDHPDGLWNPAEYFRRLQQEYVLTNVRTHLAPEYHGEDLEQRVDECFQRELTAPEAPRPRWPLYVVAEKILCADENLPEDWAVAGTTGYDFLNELNGLFVAGESARDFDAIYARFLGRSFDFSELVRTAKKMIMLVSMAGEINALAHQLDRISERNRQYRDFTLGSLAFVIREMIACLNVYRSYVTGPEGVAPHDRRFVEDATATAKRLNPRTAASIFDFVRDTLLLDNLPGFREEDRPLVIAWSMKFQQVSGPVMAKGVEDTAFYIYNRLASLNEVGGRPSRFGVSVEEFHAANAARAKQWPHALLATSTHDTKRSEDVRARINVLSEMPEAWQAAVDRWAALNASKKPLVDGSPAPDRNDEYLLYQTLVGTWPDEVEAASCRFTAKGENPKEEERWGERKKGKEQTKGPPITLSGEALTAYRDRIAAYMEKASREAKVHTSWINPHQAYDAAVRDFVHRLLGGDPEDAFLADLVPFSRRVAFFGRLGALSQTLLKLACPGVPDFYQGTELWNFRLVDPDNRRNVDYPLRHKLLTELLQEESASPTQRTSLLNQLLVHGEDGRLKLFVISRMLHFRRDHRTLFDAGEYLPLDCEGKRARHVCAFARRHDDEVLIVVAPRCLVGLTGGTEKLPLGKSVWEDTRVTVPGEFSLHRLQNLLTGELPTFKKQKNHWELPLARILKQFPIAALIVEHHS